MDEEISDRDVSTLFGTLSLSSRSSACMDVCDIAKGKKFVPPEGFIGQYKEPQDI